MSLVYYLQVIYCKINQPFKQKKQQTRVYNLLNAMHCPLFLNLRLVVGLRTQSGIFVSFLQISVSFLTLY